MFTLGQEHSEFREEVEDVEENRIGLSENNRKCCERGQQWEATRR